MHDVFSSAEDRSLEAETDARGRWRGSSRAASGPSASPETEAEPETETEPEAAAKDGIGGEAGEGTPKERGESEVPDPDLALMQAVASGDKAAQAALIARILPSVLGRARGLCRAPADADDAAQEALLEILRSARSFSGRGSLQGWCDRITVRTTLRRQRRELRKLVLLDSACDLEQLPARGREIPLREAVPGELQDYLAELSADRYEALCLWAKGHAIDEIAEHTGASPNTIKDRLRMARKQVRRAIRQREVLGELARARTQTKEGERA